MFVSLVAALALTAQAETANPETDALAPAAASPVLELQTAEDDALIRDEAEQYVAFHAVISDLQSSPIGGPEDLDNAMDRLTAFYGEDRLVRAWIAYTAMVAAQHPEYLDDVRELADYYGTNAALSGLMYDPAYATSFVHADEAEASVVAALDSDTQHIREASELYRAAAYDLQNARWAQRRMNDRQDRLDAITNSDLRSVNLTADQQASFNYRMDGSRAASQLFQQPADIEDLPMHTPQLSLAVGSAPSDPDSARIGRILSVAALQSLDGDPAHTEQVIDALLSDPVVERCLAWVRLDLQQCVAAGHFKYEDSFCIAEHALLDVSRCIGASRPSSN